MSWVKETMDDRHRGRGRPKNAPGYNVQNNSRFRVKRPITSFRDLEIYQRTQEMAKLAVKNVLPAIAGKGYPAQERFVEKALGIPAQIAEAHSRRFDDEPRALALLTDAYEACNAMVVHLEQIREIYAGEGERAACDELLGKYFAVRVKIRNLGKAWQPWMLEKKMPQAQAGKPSPAAGPPLAITYHTSPNERAGGHPQWEMKEKTQR